MAHHKVFAGTFVLYIAILAFIAYIAFRPISESYLDADALDATTKSDVDAYSCNAEGGCFKNTSPTHFEVTLKEPTKRIKVHAAVDMVAPLTVNGSLVATAADVEKVRYPGPKGETGQQGSPGKDFDPSIMQEAVKTKKLQLGDKFMFSAVGDAHANDDWLRMFDKDGKGYNGGFAAGRLWTPSFYSNSEGTNLKGGESAHNPNKWGTHFPGTDNRNYIRGDTEMRGDTNHIGAFAVGGQFTTNTISGDSARQSGRLHVSGNEHLYLLNKDGVIVGKEWGGNGNLSVQGNLSMAQNANVQGKLFFGDPTLSTNAHGTNNSDPYYIEKKVFSGNNSQLRLTINDDHDESFQIWGQSCSAGNCHGEGQPRFKFYADGRMCIKDTCINEDDLKKLKGAIGGDGPAPSLVASSVKFPVANNTWTIQPESDIAFVIRDGTSGGDKRYALFKNKYQDL